MDKSLKILVLSISSWNLKVGMNTWPSLLEGHDPENIAHICLRDEVPDNPICNNYFVISESKVLKSILKRRIKTGYRLERGETDERLKQSLEEHNKIYSKKEAHKNINFFAREFVWKLGKWKTKELYQFVKDFNPDVIMYETTGYIHFNTICRYVKKISKAKSIGFFVDDTFTYKQRKGFIANIPRFFQRKSLKKLVKKTDGFFAITDKTKREADEFFNINCTVLTKPIKTHKEVINKEISLPLEILYTGNLGIGRDKSLYKLCSSLEEINKDGDKFKVVVYTKTTLKDCFNVFKFLEVNAPIPQAEVLKKQEQTDILLFLEDIDGNDAKVARLSFSTKITDYLGSGKCIFAIGNGDIAPMEYFKENDCAILAENEEEIKKRLNEILADLSLIDTYAKNAYNVGLKNHNKDKILSTFNEVIENLVKRDI